MGAGGFTFPDVYFLLFKLECIQGIVAIAVDNDRLPSIR